MIEWTGKVWNPTTGCTKISAGCRHCYAERMAGRLHKMGQDKYSGGFAPRFHPQALDAPRRWKRPALVFVNSMSDLFHDAFSDGQIAAVWDVMEACPQHTFQVLTKRAERLTTWMRRRDRKVLPNVWIGVSVEDQQHADLRLAYLAQVSAAVRFVSCEPLLGPVDLQPWLPELDWVIVGGESHPRKACARRLDVAAAQRLVDACQAAAVPVFVKQLGSNQPHANAGRRGQNMDTWPASLRVRQMPGGSG